MTNDRLRCEAALLVQVLPKIIEYLLVRRQPNRRLRVNGAHLAKHDQQPVQCGLVTGEWAAMLASKGLVLRNHPFIDVTKAKLLTGKPTTEIAHNTKAAPCALPTMPLLQQSS